MKDVAGPIRELYDWLGEELRSKMFAAMQPDTQDEYYQGLLAKIEELQEVREHMRGTYPGLPEEQADKPLWAQG